MNWTTQALEALPRKHGFRLRGLEMTRLETFVDAAFASIASFWHGHWERSRRYGLEDDVTTLIG